MPYQNVNGVRMYYEEVAADGPVLLLIHGAAQDTISWRFNIEHISKKFHVYAIDLPGHGKSQLAPCGAISDLETYAFFAEGFMESMGISKYSVMGHSMAGGIGLHMALHQPDRLQMVILVDGACYTSGTYGDDTFDLVSINPTDWFEVNFRTICSPKTDFERIQEIAFDVRRCAPEVAFNDIRAYASLNLLDKIGTVKVPLIALHGEDDWSIPPELGEKTLELAGGFTLFKKLINVGHFPQTENPEVFNQAFDEVINKVKIYSKIL
jgi:pimeloyl-ACP methyl ester carboxylesterase